MSQNKKLFKESEHYLPGGVNSPVRAFRAVSGDPVFFKKGRGPHAWDEDDNKYLDFCNSWGPLILGHLDPAVRRAVKKQNSRGHSFGVPTRVEMQMARYIVRRVPWVEKIRFVSSGTEAVMSALRLARGYTDRRLIVKFEGCYHGHSDGLLTKAGSGLVTFGEPASAGIPEDITRLTLTLPLNDSQALEDAFSKHGSDIAAVIIEGVPANNGLLIQTPEYMQKLRDLCTRNGSLLVLDEVITGFRLGFRGAAGHYNIQPDLVTYGKVVGGGFPVGAFGGKAEIFSRLAPEGPVYQAGTLSGNPMAMAAGLAALKELNGKRRIYRHLDKLGAHLEKKWKEAKIPLGLARLGSIFWLYRGEQAPRAASEIDGGFAETYAGLHRFLLSRGVYLAPSSYEVGFLSAPMEKKHINRLVREVAAFFGRQ